MRHLGSDTTRPPGPALARPMRAPYLVAGIAALFLSSCRLVGPEAVSPAPEPMLDTPAIVEGVSDEAEALEVARILTEGEALLAEGRYEEARTRARDVEERFVSATGSASSLWLRARSSKALEDWEDASTAIERYLALISPESASWADAALLRAEVRWDGGLGGGLEALFAVPADADERQLTRADEVASRWASELNTAALRDLILEAPPHPRLRPVFLTELAVRRHLVGDTNEAQALAAEALDLAPGEVVANRALNVAEGRVDGEFAVAAVVGAILPGPGSSPSVLQLSEEIRAGIEVAMVVEEGMGSLPIRLVSVEHGSGSAGVTDALERFEREGVAGVVGPLLDPLLSPAVGSRARELPILSPTARMLPAGVQGVYSLASVDPAAGEALARMVLGQGIRDVVVIHPSSPDATEEARWFSETFTGNGGTIRRTLTYPVGATGFGTQLEEVVRLAPAALVAIVPQSDVQLLGPQIAYYGVDDLETLRIVGSESWTSQPVLQGVQPRHTDGVLSVTSWVVEGEFGPGWDQFVVAYEEHFQRTLRSPMPALGYDAMRLLIRAAREGGGSSEGTLQAMGGIRDFPGATGLLSVVNGRIQREYVGVRIQDRRLVPLDR